jgi:SAM-dependent methyltransferase
MVREFARSLVKRMPGISGLLAQRDRLLAQQEQLLERLDQQGQSYFMVPPSSASAFELFKGEWASSVPGFGTGSAALFDDSRVNWLGEQLRGFAGKRVLELGPLEGGHTCMMAAAGAAEIVAIEANTRAFMKCLIVKNAIKFEADFRLGDFRQYLADTADRYDFVLACGVLYHMSEPVRLLADMVRVARSLGVWTHYYDHDAIARRADLSRRFAREPSMQRLHGRTVVTYEQRYVHAANSPWFRGGTGRSSHWFTKDSLLDVLDALDLNVVIHDITPDHPDGPSMLFHATRRSGD